MSTLAIVLVAAGVLLLLLFLGGLIAVGRRADSLDGELRARITAANYALAEAHAQDNGWERSALEQTARDEFTRLNPGVAIDALHLVQVVDNPGTDSDQAVFRIVSGGEPHTLTLGRSSGAWVAA